MIYSNALSRAQKGRSLVGFPPDFCVVDIETTGLNPYTDSIIEIGAIRYRGGVAEDTFSSLLQPPYRYYYGGYVSPFIENLTGITNEMLEAAPPSLDVLAAFYDFLGDDLVLGYNVNFDVNFLFESFVRYLGFPLKNDFIDILRMAKKLYPAMPHHRLSDMTARFGFVNEHAHRALSDCEVTADCYFEFHREALRQYGSEEQFLKTYQKKYRLTVL